MLLNAQSTAKVISGRQAGATGLVGKQQEITGRIVESNVTALKFQTVGETPKVPSLPLPAMLGEVSCGDSEVG